MPNSPRWQEQIAPDEAERFARYAAMITSIQSARDAGRTPARALHARQTAGVRATFEVLPDLPEQARVGIFAAPGKFDAWVRYSNGSPNHQSDRKTDIRGMALKVIGVPGKKLIQGLEDARTQDFLMIQSPIIPFKNSDEFMFFVGAAAKPLTLPFKLIGRFGFKRLLQIGKINRERFSAFIPTIAGQRFWTPVPIQWGEGAVKYSAVPVGPHAASTIAPGPTYLADDVADRLSRGDVTYDFRVQFFVDETTTPIEDASVEWPESASPFVTVARIVIPKQDVRGAEGAALAETIEKGSFDPWHAPEAFRPLGDVMRARKVAYFASTQGRGASAEPTDTPAAAETA